MKRKLLSALLACLMLGIPALSSCVSSYGKGDATIYEPPDMSTIALSEKFNHLEIIWSYEEFELSDMKNSFKDNSFEKIDEEFFQKNAIVIYSYRIGALYPYDSINESFAKIENQILTINDVKIFIDPHTGEPFEDGKPIVAELIITFGLGCVKVKKSDFVDCKEIQLIAEY